MPELYPTSIYGLVDPRTNELRYVGKTIQPLNDRLRIHLYDARRGLKRYVCNWIRQVLRDGLEPEIFEIESVQEDWIEQEQFWIAYFRYIGARLTNGTIGGEGTPGRKASAETLAKMSEISKRTQMVPSVRAKKSESMRRNHADPEIHARISQGIKAAVNRPDVKARSDAARVRPDVMARRVASIKATFDAEPERLKRRGDAIRASLANPEVRKRKSESTKRRHAEHPFSAETRAKLSKAFKGRVFTPEWRKKMSIAAIERRRREKAEKET